LLCDVSDTKQRNVTNVMWCNAGGWGAIFASTTLPFHEHTCQILSKFAEPFRCQLEEFCAKTRIARIHTMWQRNCAKLFF